MRTLRQWMPLSTTTRCLGQSALPIWLRWAALGQMSMETKVKRWLKCRQFGRKMIGWKSSPQTRRPLRWYAPKNSAKYFFGCRSICQFWMHPPNAPLAHLSRSNSMWPHRMQSSPTSSTAPVDSVADVRLVRSNSARTQCDSMAHATNQRPINDKIYPVDRRASDGRRASWKSVSYISPFPTVRPEWHNVWCSHDEAK